MPIPADLLSTKDDWALFINVGIWLNELVQKKAGEYTYSDAEQILSQTGFATMVLSDFMAKWENCGSFTYTAWCYRENSELVVRALELFGCDFAASKVMESILLTEQFSDDKTDEQWEALAAIREPINIAATGDAPYSKLAAVVRAKAEKIGLNSP